MGKYSEFYDARDFITELVKKEVIGPGEEDETLMDIYPLDAYVSGVLWAQTHAGKGTDDDLSRSVDTDLEVFKDGELSDDEDGIPTEIEIEERSNDNLAGTQVAKPSTMAITVMLDSDVKGIFVRFSFGKYSHDKEMVPGKDGEKEIHVYRRKSYSFELELDLSKDKTRYLPLNGKELENMNLSVVAFKRFGGIGQPRLFTFSVTNGPITDKSKISLNENAVFQCELELRPMSGNFLCLDSGNGATRNIEEEILEMQYMDEHNFAQGHGCATGWDLEDGKCRCVRSDFMPIHELMQMRPRIVEDNEIFSLKYLYSAERNEIIGKLQNFMDMYHAWYDGQKKMSAKPEYVQYSRATEDCLKKILMCESRIRSGIDVLSRDGVAWRGFVCANKAMYYQRISMALMKGEINSEDEFIVKKDDPHWYPFQLFYLIMIIPDFTDKNSEYKDVVDLLWFPTGGGKTEAYMAVSAFTIFYERLSSERKNFGTTIIMRYTLRLLTIQQFERAAALICSCDRVRQEEGIRGDEISLGLWIGGDSTPNDISKADESLKALKTDKYYNGPNPVQLTHCPCCGKKLRAENYNIVDSHMEIRCNGCQKVLPIYVVDTDIYDRMPTLLISTVDKFARIVWEEKSGNIFGCGADVNKPRLIIQDELHLISGALGTLTGLYESAVDRLCWDENGNKPKIISSTATVKNAGYQIKGLYDRDYFQFPPNGLKHTDSFFAVEASRDEKPSRMYVGLSNQAGSAIGLMIKLYSALVVADYYIEKQGYGKEVIDQYYTVIGYFNSIRELGTVSSVLQERIATHIRALLNGKFRYLSEKYGADTRDDRYVYPHYMQKDELTSRKSATEVVDILKYLETHFTTDDNETPALNYVLCSNMFSVGVDIDRLGLMAMYGQPKSNSDYIQATSRVGRSEPGLIFSMYSLLNTRDRSYYEQFTQYHRCFYKFVEPTSVTPFSLRSIERGLHSVFVALVRFLCPGMRANNSAKSFNPSDHSVTEIREYLLARIRDIQPDTEPEAEEYLHDFISYWQEIKSGNLVYNSHLMGNQSGNYKSLLESAETGNAEYTTLNSLRNVEKSSGIYIDPDDIRIR